MKISLNFNWEEGFSAQDLDEMEKIVSKNTISGEHPQWTLNTQDLLDVKLSPEGVRVLFEIAVDAGRYETRVQRYRGTTNMYRSGRD